MAGTPRIDRLERGELSQIKLEYTSAPHTQIQNRAPMVDLSQDGRPRMGVERVMIQDVIQLPRESGPSGELVYKPVNDFNDQVRIYGEPQSNADLTGTNIAFLSESVAEITFYGTGFNLLTIAVAGDDIRYSVDGGSESANIWIDQASVIQGRNYSPNVILPIVSGLSLGLHTIKLRFVTGTPRISGYETLNERSDVLVPAFSSSARSYPETALPYNSGFESGTLGTKGGRVLIYAKDDKTIKHAVTPTEATQLNLAAADHSNEEVIAEHFIREFGAGRSDDWSGAISNSDLAFTLDDGTTTLVADGAAIQEMPDGAEAVAANAAGEDFVTFTFVGTGLDVITHGSGGRSLDVKIDGVHIGGSPSISDFDGPKLQRIASGLPYGTHTVTLGDASGSSARIRKFLVYGPKKPTLPEGAIELGEYFVTGDFTANATAGLATLSGGVIRKDASREITYSSSGGGGGEALNLALNVTENIGGWAARSNQNWEASCTFFGTGLDLRCFPNTNRSDDIDVYVDDVLFDDSHPNYSAPTTYGNTSFTPATGKLSMNGTLTIGAGFIISGLPLGVHTVRFENNAVDGNDYMFIHSMDVITPVHSPKLNGPFVKQNTLRVGSESVRDLRKLNTFSNQVANCDAITANQSSSSTSHIPAAEMHTTVKTTGKPIRVSFESAFDGAAGYVRMFVDGSPVHYEQYGSGGDSRGLISMNLVLPISAGEHTVYVQFRSLTSGMRLYSTLRSLTVEELD